MQSRPLQALQGHAIIAMGVAHRTIEPLNINTIPNRALQGRNN